MVVLIPPENVLSCSSEGRDEMGVGRNDESGDGGILERMENLAIFCGVCLAVTFRKNRAVCVVVVYLLWKRISGIEAMM